MEYTDKIVTIEELRAKSMPLVPIIGYAPGETINFRLKAIDLMVLVKSGKIPNQLLGGAKALFDGKSKGSDAFDSLTNTGDKLGDVTEIVDVICESCMVEPRYEDAKEFLTMQQKMEIFTWSQSGIEGLKSFRTQQRDIGHISNV